MTTFIYLDKRNMISESVTRVGMLSIAFLGLITTLVVNREKLRWAKLKIEIMSDACKVNYRINQILDFQINLRIQAIKEKICLEKITLICKEGELSGKPPEVFKKAVNIEGDLTKYSEDEFAQFIGCLQLGYDCSKILEYESRFRPFIQLKDLILEEDIPRSITLLGRIDNCQMGCNFFLRFDYDLNGSRKKLLKKLDFKQFFEKTQNFSD